MKVHILTIYKTKRAETPNLGTPVLTEAFSTKELAIEKRDAFFKKALGNRKTMLDEAKDHHYAQILPMESPRWNFTFYQATIKTLSVH